MTIAQILNKMIAASNGNIHDIDHLLRDLRLRHAGAGEKGAHQHGALLLLILAVGVAIFLAAERAAACRQDRKPKPWKHRHIHGWWHPPNA